MERAALAEPSEAESSGCSGGLTLRSGWYIGVYDDIRSEGQKRSQYRSYQQTTQRSPHASTSRRGPGPIVASSHSQQSVNNAQLLAQTELAKRRARKPTDKNIPDGVEDIIIGDGVQQYKDLREVERRLDAAMMRKRLDIQDSVNRDIKRYKTLRIWISNTAENQPWQARGLDENAFDFSTGIEATYRVKIEGRLLEDEDPSNDLDKDSDDGTDPEDVKGKQDVDTMEHDGEDSSKSKTATTPQPRKKLSHFFKSIAVDFDRVKSVQPDAATQIEWKKPPVHPNIHNPPSSADFDCLEFERKSDENVNCTINLIRDDTPERFRLSKELAEVLDLDEAARGEIVTGVWEYVNALGLLPEQTRFHCFEDEEKRGIRCDERLRAVFKSDQLFFPLITNLVTPHISPLPPLKLPYTIRVDPEYHRNPTPTIYDIRVAMEDPLRAKLVGLTTNPSYPATLRQIATLDDQLALVVQATAHSKAKHAFFTSMSKDPANFIKRWTSSQKRDLEVILGEASRGVDEESPGEEFRRGGVDGVWGTDIVKQAVGIQLAKAR
ncbi:MAG: SWI/SNF complex component snf12 [Pleopsidium flavum]|nr:MAG: SWI/SNF complex component snf12 [Pleopsidium flavum]